jgi:hypothetical protein
VVGRDPGEEAAFFPVRPFPVPVRWIECPYDPPEGGELGRSAGTLHCRPGFVYPSQGAAATQLHPSARARACPW